MNFFCLITVMAPYHLSIRSTGSYSNLITRPDVFKLSFEPTSFHLLFPVAMMMQQLAEGVLLLILLVDYYHDDMKTSWCCQDDR